MLRLIITAMKSLRNVAFGDASKTSRRVQPRKFNNAHILPILLFLWFVGSFIVSYSIAVYKHHAVAVIPFLSDTASYAPESAIFGQLMNIGCVLMMISNYIRYLHVEYILRNNHLNRYTGILNKTCLWLGFLVTMGVSIVANFQEPVAFVIHLIGSGLAVGFGVFFQISQTIMCVLIYPEVGSLCVNRFRIVLVVVSCICLGRCIPPYFAGLTSTGTTLPADSRYHYIVVNAFVEWMIILLTMVFILTFVSEFRKICFYEPKIDVSKSN